MSECVSVCQLPDDGWFGVSSTLIEGERERSSSDNQVIKAAACLLELSEDKAEMTSAQPHVVTAAVTASASVMILPPPHRKQMSRNTKTVACRTIDTSNLSKIRRQARTIRCGT